MARKERPQAEQPEQQAERTSGEEASSEQAGSTEATEAEASEQPQAQESRRRERVAEIQRQAEEQELPHGSVERAVETGLRDPSVDVADPTSVYSNAPELAGVTDEATAMEAAARLGRQVPIPGQPGTFARPNGKKGPYQPL